MREYEFETEKKNLFFILDQRYLLVTAEWQSECYDNYRNEDKEKVN